MTEQVTDHVAATTDHVTDHVNAADKQIIKSDTHQVIH